MQIRNRKTGEVVKYSRRAARIRRMQRRVFGWADFLKPFMERRGKGYRLVMITPTYAPEHTWRPNDIRDLMLKCKAELGDNLMAYAWVAEMQRRGEVHYHVLLLVRQGTRIPYPDREGWWPWGSTRIETAKSVYYICKYVGKEYQKGAYPKHLRVFAVWIRRDVLSPSDWWRFRLTALPRWLAAEVSASVDAVGQKISRVVGGGWECAGKVFVSPWEVVTLI